MWDNSRQMTRTPRQKRAWKTTQRTQRKRMANMRVFNKFFFIYTKSVLQSTAGAKQQKMPIVPRVPNGKKTNVFWFIRSAWLRRLKRSHVSEITCRTRQTTPVMRSARNHAWQVLLEPTTEILGRRKGSLGSWELGNTWMRDTTKSG